VTRLVPFPIATVAIFLTWIALSGGIAPLDIAGALLLALVVPLLCRPLLGEPSRVRAPATAMRLMVVVVRDIIVSNIVVARLVLGPVARIRPGFVTVPLDVSHPYAVSLLASIITMTPGTVSADVSEARREILVHVLDLDDPDALVRDIKTRYEHPLKEIFEC
jgi:multicomponent K+:H+ antiporter subunit E